MIKTRALRDEIDSMQIASLVERILSAIINILALIFALSRIRLAQAHKLKKIIPLSDNIFFLY